MTTKKPTFSKIHPVKSSQVQSIGYCPATKTLAVNFNSGGQYHYHDVSQEHFDGLLKAESAGKYLGQHIKPKHKYSKVGTGE